MEVNKTYETEIGDLLLPGKRPNHHVTHQSPSLHQA